MQSNSWMHCNVAVFRPVTLVFMAALVLFGLDARAQNDRNGWGIVRTVDLPKASGLELEVWFPGPWTVREGVMPYVVMQGTDEPVDGKASSCSLLVRDIAKLSGDPSGFVTRAYVQQAIPTMARNEAKRTGVVIEAEGRSTVSDVPSYWFTGTLAIQAGDVKISQMMYSELFFYRRWQINLMCAETADSASEARARFRRSEKTFRAITASINLPGLWRQ